MKMIFKNTGCYPVLMAGVRDGGFPLIQRKQRSWNLENLVGKEVNISFTLAVTNLNSQV